MLSKLVRYLVLPSEITQFERQYLGRVNRIALRFFLLHVPALTLIAALNHTGPLTAALLSVAVVAGPALAMRAVRNPRRVSLVFGVTAALMGGLLVHFGRGLWTIEMHFYFFVALALLAVFANPLVVLAAALTIALHHAVLWAVQPASLFNYDAPLTSVLVHSAFVVLESVAACFVARSFFDNVIGLERIVAVRTQALDSKNREMRIMFDNVKQGFLTVDRHGALAAECSRAVTEWIGSPVAGEPLWTFFGRVAPDFGAWLAVSWEAMLDDVLPLELTLSQLPPRLVQDGRTLEIAYQPIYDGEVIERFLIIVTDATERLAREHADLLQRETMEVFQNVARDRQGFVEFLSETSTRVALLAAEPYALDEAQLKREVHTIKGNCALFGVASVAAVCHRVESRCAEGADGVTAAERREIVEAWRGARERLAVLVERDRDWTIELDSDEYQKLLAAAAQSPASPEVLRMVTSFQYQSARKRLSRLAEQARALAARQGKGDVEVAIDDGGVRLPAPPLAGFWAALVHVVRNAIDHGLASGEGRRPPQLTFSSRIDGGMVRIALADNGLGIDWDAVRRVALKRGLPAATSADLEEALFSDGLSTREVASELSGRGVGLAAVRQQCRSLGGQISVRSVAGEGTCFEFRLPIARVFSRGRGEVAHGGDLESTPQHAHG